MCKDQKGNFLSEQMKPFFTDPLKFQSPEHGENIQDILKRTREFWLEKTVRSGSADKTVLIASNGCAVRALLQNIYQDTGTFLAWLRSA